MAVLIILITVFMMSGWSYSGKRTIYSGILTGAFAGIITESCGVPGFPLQVMYFHTSDSSAEIKRANVLTVKACSAFMAIFGPIM